MPPEPLAQPATRRRHEAVRDHGAPPRQEIHNLTPANIRLRARTPAYTVDNAAAAVVQRIQRNTGVREEAGTVDRYRRFWADRHMAVFATGEVKFSVESSVWMAAATRVFHICTFRFLRFLLLLRCLAYGEWHRL
jgi:hypothetical protein